MPDSMIFFMSQLSNWYVQYSSVTSIERKEAIIAFSLFFIFLCAQKHAFLNLTFLSCGQLPPHFKNASYFHAMTLIIVFIIHNLIHPKFSK